MYIMYSIDDLHYNSKDVVQVSPEEFLEDMASAMSALEIELKKGSSMEQRMLSFFQKKVRPEIAYRDNDVDQGKGGPRRLFVVGKWKAMCDDGLFVRLGISAPDENPLIPALQMLYLSAGEHMRFIEGHPVGIEKNPDRWAYDFTERYQGMTKGVNVRTRTGIRSLGYIPAINEALLNGKPGL
jgi:hypothetical protein